MRYLPRNEKVYIHTNMFGTPKLIGGKVICSMREGSEGIAVIATSIGVFKVSRRDYSQGEWFTYIYEQGGTSNYRCSLYSSVDDFKSGNVMDWLINNTATKDLLGFKYQAFHQYVCYKVSDVGIKEVTSRIYNYLYDEDNDRLVPFRNLDKKIKNGDINALLIPMNAADMLDMATKQNYKDGALYRTEEDAKNAMTDAAEIIEFGDDIPSTTKKEPTLKDKLNEFVEQQGTSLEMLRTIINEIP